MYHSSLHSKILHSSHRIFIPFVCVSGKTSKYSLHNPQRPAFVTEEACVYCGRTWAFKWNGLCFILKWLNNTSQQNIWCLFK